MTFDMLDLSDSGGSVWGTFREGGQGDFSVRITKYDPLERVFVARTLSGHPLAGWRRWQVRQLPNGDVLAETFSVEHRHGLLDIIKATPLGNWDMEKTWTSMLRDVAAMPHAQVVHDEDTVLAGRWFDKSEIPERKALME